MVEAHVSFRDDFAASCEEIDVLVAIAMQQAECFGARITGGGFGGCTVNVVRAEATEKFVAALRRVHALRNSVVVVDHAPLVVSAADHVIELGPAAVVDGIVQLAQELVRAKDFEVGAVGVFGIDDAHVDHRHRDTDAVGLGLVVDAGVHRRDR